MWGLPCPSCRGTSPQIHPLSLPCSPCSIRPKPGQAGAWWHESALGGQGRGWQTCPGPVMPGVVATTGARRQLLLVSSAQAPDQGAGKSPGICPGSALFCTYWSYLRPAPRMISLCPLRALKARSQLLESLERAGLGNAKTLPPPVGRPVGEEPRASQCQQHKGFPCPCPCPAVEPCMWRRQKIRGKPEL